MGGRVGVRDLLPNASAPVDGVEAVGERRLESDAGDQRGDGEPGHKPAPGEVRHVPATRPRRAGDNRVEEPVHVGLQMQLELDHVPAHLSANASAPRSTQTTLSDISLDHERMFG